MSDNGERPRSVRWLRTHQLGSSVDGIDDDGVENDNDGVRVAPTQTRSPKSAAGGAMQNNPTREPSQQLWLDSDHHRRATDVFTRQSSVVDRTSNRESDLSEWMQSAIEERVDNYEESRVAAALPDDDGVYLGDDGQRAEYENEYELSDQRNRHAPNEMATGSQEANIDKKTSKLSASATPLPPPKTSTSTTNSMMKSGDRLSDADEAEKMQPAPHQQAKDPSQHHLSMLEQHGAAWTASARAETNTSTQADAPKVPLRRTTSHEDDTTPGAFRIGISHGADVARADSMMDNTVVIGDGDFDDSPDEGNDAGTDPERGLRHDDDETAPPSKSGGDMVVATTADGTPTILCAELVKRMSSRPQLRIEELRREWEEEQKQLRQTVSAQSTAIIVQADAVSDDSSEGEEDRNVCGVSRRNLPVVLIGSAFVLAVIIVGVVLRVSDNGNSTDDSQNGTAAVPTIPPTPSPTSAPTVSRFDDLVERFHEHEQSIGIQFLPPSLTGGDSSDATAIDQNSKPFQTLTWMADDDPAKLDFTNTSISVLIERYVSALFFFSSSKWENDLAPEDNAWLSDLPVCRWMDACGDDETVLNHFRIISQPSLLGAIPTEIGLATRLTSITMTNTSMTDSIPSTMGRLTDLESLDLRRNVFTGKIPSELGLFSKLTLLDLYFNALRGPIPTTLANLADTLTVLDLAANFFDNTRFDDVICQLPNTFASADCLENKLFFQVDCTCCSQCCNLTNCIAV